MYVLCVTDENPEIKTTAPLYSCMQPVDISQHIAERSQDDICISPAEGNKPFQALGTEADCFPTKFPDGKNSFEQQRPVKLGIGTYLNQRLFNLHNTFASDPTYIFWAQYVKEMKEISACVSVAMRKSSNTYKGKKITSDELLDKNYIKDVFRTDEGYKFMKTVRGTPTYWEQTLRDLKAMIRQLGVPTFFASFSAADRRWTEIIKCICIQLGKPFDENMDWSTYCQLINENIVTASRMFDHRVNTFLKNFLMSKANVIGEVTDYFHRVEFQARGWPHLHCLIWIKDAKEFGKDDDNTVQFY